jgi:hypothetical protein
MVHISGLPMILSGANGSNKQIGAAEKDVFENVNSTLLAQFWVMLTAEELE